MEGLELFAAAGVRVISVDNFEHVVAWVRDLDLLIIDADLSPQDRQQVTRHYLPAILGAWSPQS